MSPRPPPLPGRVRTPSGHDIPIPESVFQAIQHVDKKVEGMRAEVAGMTSAIADLTKVVTTATSSWKDKAVTQLGAIILAGIAAFGGSRLMLPAAEPVRTVIQQTPVDPRMGACIGIQPGTMAQSECFAKVQAEIQSGKRAPADTRP